MVNILMSIVTAVQVLCLLGAAAGVYLLVRNDWVFNRRMDAIHKNDGLEEYDSLLSYDDMLYRKFWVWDVRKLRK